MNDRVLVDVLNGHLRTAVLRGGGLDDLFLLSVEDMAPVGAIFLGRVRRVLPGLNGAFVDIGTATDGFLRASAARQAGLVSGDLRSDLAPGADERPKIDDLVSEGQAIAVQVARPAAEGKGPVVTTELTLAGRFVVLKGLEPGLAISRRIGDDDIRNRLARLLEADGDGGPGFIVRTAAGTATDAAITAEVDELLHAWDELRERLRTTEPITRIDETTSPLQRVLREIDLESVAEIKVQGVDRLDVIRRQIEVIWPDIAERIVLESGAVSLFESAGVEEALFPFRRQFVELFGGGTISVEKTRALTAIDVDTGSRSAGSSARNPVLDTNVAAAGEIARQLRIRNISGLVVVDFVHMRRRQDRDQVIMTLRNACAADRVGVQVLGISPLGLVEMSRERNAFAALDDVMAPG